MQAVRRKSQSVRQIRRRKEVRKFLNAYGRYIAAGTCLAAVVGLVTVAAVKYGVTGAYKHVWNKGLTETEYSKAVRRAKQRIEKQLGGEE